MANSPVGDGDAEQRQVDRGTTVAVKRRSSLDLLGDLALGKAGSEDSLREEEGDGQGGKKGAEGDHVDSSEWET